MEKLKDFLLRDEYYKKAGTLRDFVHTFLKEGTFQQLFRVSDQVLERYNLISWRLIQERRFEEAADTFFFLTFLNPHIHSFWLGLGIAEQSQEHYSDAAFSYLLAKATQLDDPIPYFNSAQCFLALGEKEIAANNLHQAVECCGESPEYSQLKNEALEMQKVCA